MNEEPTATTADVDGAAVYELKGEFEWDGNRCGVGFMRLYDVRVC